MQCDVLISALFREVTRQEICQMQSAHKNSVQKRQIPLARWHFVQHLFS